MALFPQAQGGFNGIKDSWQHMWLPLQFPERASVKSLTCSMQESTPLKLAPSAPESLGPSLHGGKEKGAMSCRGSEEAATTFCLCLSPASSACHFSCPFLDGIHLSHAGMYV